MKLRRALIGALVALMAAAGLTAVAEPALAASSTCTYIGYQNGRDVVANNFNNGGGAYVEANVCWTSRGNGYYDVGVFFDVTDTLANGAGATIRMEWDGTDTATHYDVPPSNERAWNSGETRHSFWKKSNIRLIYVRACLTNKHSEAHHCGAKV